MRRWPAYIGGHTSSDTAEKVYAPQHCDSINNRMQMNYGLTADPIDVVTALAAQDPCHCCERRSIDFLTVVLISADVAVLTEGTAHVAGSEKDRSGSSRAAREELSPV